MDRVERTVMALSITVEDKERLRRLAYDNGMSMAQVIHTLIEACVTSDSYFSELVHKCKNAETNE